MAIQSAKFENGQVFFPKEAPWLADLEAELFAFPNGPHDDQADSTSQALGHKIASFWTEESLDRYNNFLSALHPRAALRVTKSRVCCGKGVAYQARLRNAGSAQPLLVTVWAGRGVTQVGWHARKRAAQSTLKRAAVQPKIDLHREPCVLDRVVQIANPSELDVAADRAHRGAAAELEHAVSFSWCSR
jgi:hypothetical protein